MGNNGRQEAIREHGMCDTRFKESMDEVFKTCRNIKRNKSNIKDENLPSISIITPTFNRKKFFPLAILNFNCFKYPRDKIEWIIVEDSDDNESIKTLLPDDKQLENMRIKYYKLDEKMSIGAKRNYATEKSNNEVIVCMDDDDYYNPDSLRKRVEFLIDSKKKCVFCSTIACFEVNRYISIISSPNLTETHGEKISEATLTFYKSFWENNKFNDKSHNEAIDMVNNNIDECSDMIWEGIMISLIHNGNSHRRPIPPKQESNGNHFNWGEKLFKFITSLDK